jgi:hypothetical protein
MTHRRYIGHVGSRIFDREPRLESRVFCPCELCRLSTARLIHPVREFVPKVSITGWQKRYPSADGRGIYRFKPNQRFPTFFRQARVERIAS